MYFVLVNFLGEFPNSDNLKSTGARIGGLLSVLIGTGILAIPSGLIGSALEDIFNEKAEGEEEEDEDAKQAQEAADAAFGSLVFLSILL